MGALLHQIIAPRFLFSINENLEIMIMSAFKIEECPIHFQLNVETALKWFLGFQILDTEQLTGYWKH